MGISIIIPVGSNPKYFEFLPECLDSVLEQWQVGDEIVLIDDAAGVFNGLAQQGVLHKYYGDMRIRMYENPWNLGCAASWNVGQAISRNEHNILMGSDDRLLPGCLNACREIINDPLHDAFGWYNFTCVDSEGTEYNWYNNAAMITKNLWRATGGFVPESGIGAPDALLLSCLIAHGSQHLHKIKDGTPLYWVRKWQGQETGRTGRYWEEIISVRDKVTEDFKWKE